MSEYQKELDMLTKTAGFTSDILQELVDRANPRKLIYKADGYDESGNLVYDMAYCPRCEKEFEYGINDWGCNYCCDCSQALDWSNDQ
ncbi:hypothetical protein [Holdemania massiliensis]|uniref:hypothetical protein n=1 Tax=Holdemania massiliensis TaxID=1468449 RepID=UPI001F059AB0|nr:hypothetical protein [Holdemania massiliensis]MCH1939298.1 hypothetical protein [Holdemania massiliensis]